MPSYYAANPHYAPDSHADERARFALCEAEAGGYFSAATVTQNAVFQNTMAKLRGLPADLYETGRDAARAEFKRTTTAAADLCDETVRELMQTGEVSESLSYRWDELMVSYAMSEAA